LADVYSVIGYYLQNRAEVDAYVREQRQLADDARRAYEADHPNDPLRELLLARLE
jgi:lipoprotein NlpI